jgi:Uma2 family endonuclease
MLAERETNPIKDGHFKFTLEMFEALSDAGHFADQHVELLDGEIFVKGLQSEAHAYAIQNLTELFYQHFSARAVIRPQLPLVLLSPPPDFVEPDLALLRTPSTEYKTRNANTGDVLLVVEVSDSSVDRDQTTKLRAYARNGIQEYWILNLHTQQLEVYREPSGEEYLLTRKHKIGRSVAPLEFADVMLEWW